MSLFDGFLKSARDLGAQYRNVDGSIEQSMREREDIATAPAHKSDVLAFLERRIDGCVSKYEDMLSKHLAVVVRKPASFQDPTSPGARNFLSVLALQHGSNAATVKTLEIALCAMLAPTLKRELSRIVAAMDWPTEGLPLAEREAAIRKLDAKIETLSKQKAELARVAAEARIVID